MGRCTLKVSKEKTERVSTSLSKEFSNILKSEAEKKGLTVSGLMRMILMEHLEHLKNDEKKK